MEVNAALTAHVSHYSIRSKLGHCCRKQFTYARLTKVEDIIDYSNKVGLSQWKAVIEALPTKFVIRMKFKDSKFEWFSISFYLSPQMPI